VQSAATWALGLNWWLSLNTKLMFDYSETRFNGGAVEELPNGLLTNELTDRQTERVFQTRVQLAF
jgi:phosphate-selective porin OprO/OprP